MIFGNNNTNLGASTIPMAEGYDCSFGAALALVESARNDYAMFEAMVGADYKEMAICKESAGVVQEGEVALLQEAVGGGIFKKIAELFRKLVGKIKSIAHTFMSKVNGLVMKDKELVKKYGKEVVNKRNIGKLEVKWRKRLAGSAVTFEEVSTTTFNAAEGWAEESFDRVKHYLDSSINVDSIEDYKKEYESKILADEETVKLDDIGGIRAVASFLDSYASKLKVMQTNINKSTTAIEKLVKDYDKRVETAAKVNVDAKGDDIKDAEANLDAARKEYDMAQAYQVAMLASMQIATSIATIEYKQNKAAFMKAIAVNEKKLEESSVYAQAVAEAAEQEVEDVIGSAMSDEEISKLSAATTDVKDGDVNDCPCANTYGPDCYTANSSYVPAVGTVDTDLNSKEEAAFFGKMLW